jgi:hypothetical protein
MYKNIRKNLLRISFVLLTVVSLWYWNGVMCIKNDDGIEQAKAMYYQPKDTVDVVMMGSSHIHYDIDTGILWKDYGISSFDYSAAEQPLWITYYYLREFCKYQKPKVVVLDLYSPALRTEDYQYDWLLPNILGMRFSLNKLEMLNVSVERERIKDFFPSFAVYHGRLNELTVNDLLYPFSSQIDLVNFKGYKPVVKVTPQTKPSITQQESGMLSIKSEIYLQKIIDYTKEHNIELFLVVTPYITNDDQELIYNRVKEIAQVNNIDFNSTNYDYDRIGLDFEKDFMDNSHLNYSGAGKFTRYLGNELKSRFELADHRGDDRYESWEINFKEIADYVKELQE